MIPEYAPAKLENEAEESAFGFIKPREAASSFDFIQKPTEGEKEEVKEAPVLSSFNFMQPPAAEEAAPVLSSFNFTQTQEPAPALSSFDFTQKQAEPEEQVTSFGFALGVATPEAKPDLFSGLAKPE